MAPEFIPFIAVVVLVLVVLASLGAFAVSTFLVFFSKRRKRTFNIISAISVIAILASGTALFYLGSAVHKQYFLNEPMVTAAARGNIEEVRQFLDRGASPDAYGIDYVDTALIAAVKSESEDIVELLLKHGANPKLCDYKGATALDHASNADNQIIANQLRTAVETNSLNQSTQPTSDSVQR